VSINVRIFGNLPEKEKISRINWEIQVAGKLFNVPWFYSSLPVVSLAGPGPGDGIK
jgi:hypothetical protein